MLKKITGIIKTNRGFENLVYIFHKEFNNGKTLILNNENDLKEGDFILRKKNQYFNPFVRKIVIGEIKGKILEKEIQYEIRMNILMKIIFWIDTIVLITIGGYYLISEEYEIGLAILLFVIFMFLVINIWMKSDIKYLENQFKEKMKFI